VSLIFNAEGSSVLGESMDCLSNGGGIDIFFVDGKASSVEGGTRFGEEVMNRVLVEREGMLLGEGSLD